MQKTFKTARALVVALHIMTPFATTHTAHAKGKLDLPPPAVSRALDAILLPINPAVAREFKLGKGEKGLLVLAVQPGGVADKQGIKAGDVLTEVLGHRVKKPIDVDVAVRRGLKRNNDNFRFGLYRAGAPLAVTAVITLALYEEVFSVSEISSWSSWSESTSFSYSEFVSEYSESIETSYESEETTVEEEVSHEETTSEESTSDESTTEDSATEDSDSDGTPDASDTDDDNDGTPDAADTDDDNDGTPDSAESEDAAPDADDAGEAGDDASDDAGSDDDAGADDDAGGDDGGDDAGGDDSGGDDGE